MKQLSFRSQSSAKLEGGEIRSGLIHFYNSVRLKSSCMSWVKMGDKQWYIKKVTKYREELMSREKSCCPEW